MELPFSQACENNKRPILAVLKSLFNESARILEVGSGTGQHACFFAENLPHVTWQCSDLVMNHDFINARISQFDLENLLAPISLDLTEEWQLPLPKYDGIFTANTLHIVSEALVKKFMTGAGKHLRKEGLLCIYGPFNYDGKFTSDSNENFDLWLKDRDKNSGIRDFEWLAQLAEKAHLSLLADNTMPANNRLLVFQKLS